MMVISSGKIFEVILLEFFIGLAFQIVIAFPGKLVVGFLKKRENVDVFDNNISFNPFKLDLD